MLGMKNNGWRKDFVALFKKLNLIAHLPGYEHNGWRKDGARFLKGLPKRNWLRPLFLVTSAAVTIGAISEGKFVDREALREEFEHAIRLDIEQVRAHLEKEALKNKDKKQPSDQKQRLIEAPGQNNTNNQIFPSP